MEKIYEKQMQIPNVAVDCFGKMKTSWLLACLQEVAGEHCTLLGANNGEYEGRHLFWAVSRYRVQITRVDRSGEDLRQICLQVTDPHLLALTGGIVQGMSGSPIIQNGKLVGAVTHVLVEEPTRGYGILMENMLAAAA